MAPTSLVINGRTHSVDVAPDTPLLWVLRDSVGLNGTKFGCGVGQCGACTVLVDGVATKSCRMTLGGVGTKKVTTIEGLAPDASTLHPVQQAWIDEEVPQCGYCQSGQIMAATALLAKNKNPSDAEIDAAMTNICRCGTYIRIRKGVRRAVKSMGGAP